jgi:hypothetical protein
MKRRYTPRKSTRNHPCVFNHPFVREQVDPRVKVAWAERYGGRAPYGNLRLSWREMHCQTLNPYGSDTCAYRPEQCAMAFLIGVERLAAVPNISEKSAIPYFRAIAHSMALERADDKPLAREKQSGTLVHDEAQGPGDARDVRLSDEERWELHRARSRPIAIGDLLGSLHVGPREGRADDGEASPVERDAPSRDMRTAPSSGVGDEPPSTPSGIPEGGELT